MKALLSITAIAASILTADPASATLLTFEDVTTDTMTPIETGYGGLNWDNFGVVHKSAEPGTGYERGAISGNYAAYNRWGLPAAITAISDTFSFDSAWFTAAWDDSLSVLIEGFTDADGIADYSVMLSANNMTPLFFEAGWTNLRALRFTSVNIANQFVMDDLQINEDATTEVPEPLTIGLLGMGLLGVAGARRRRKV